MANAIELIKADHKNVEQLYQRYHGSNGQTQQQQAIIQEICQALTIHAQLEEELFYPAVERQLGNEGATLGTAARKEHREMKRAMSQLQATGFVGPRLERDFSSFRHVIEPSVEYHYLTGANGVLQSIWNQANRVCQQAKVVEGDGDWTEKSFDSRAWQGIKIGHKDKLRHEQDKNRTASAALVDPDYAGADEHCLLSMPMEIK